jgi:hypothetical protein
VNALPSRRGHARRPFRPQLEKLEDRYCLTAARNPFSIAGTTLTITGDNAGVAVRYEGAMIDPQSHLSHGHVWAWAAGTTIDAEIDKVVINSPDGPQGGTPVPVRFRLDAPLVTSFTLQENVGANNAADMDFSAGIQGAGLYVGFNGAGGDVVTSRFGNISNNNSQNGVIFNATLGDTYNTFVSDLNGNLTAGSISYTVQGGNGGNFIAVNAGTAAYAGGNHYVPKTSIAVDQNSAVSVDLRGGLGSDTIVTQFVGSLQGKYGRIITGHDVAGVGSELGATDILLPGSTGVYHGAVRGGNGSDRLSQYLSTPPQGDDGGSLQSLVSWVDTYSGHGSVNVSPGVGVYHDGNNPGIQNF